MMISAIVPAFVMIALAFYIIPFIEKEGFVIEFGAAFRFWLPNASPLRQERL